MFQTRGGSRTLYLWTRQLRAVCFIYHFISGTIFFNEFWNNIICSPFLSHFWEFFMHTKACSTCDIKAHTFRCSYFLLHSQDISIYLYIWISTHKRHVLSIHANCKTLPTTHVSVWNINGTNFARLTWLGDKKELLLCRKSLQFFLNISID